MDFISFILTEMKFQTGMRFSSCEDNLPEMKWISADSLDVGFNVHVSQSHHYAQLENALQKHFLLILHFGNVYLNYESIEDKGSRGGGGGGVQTSIRPKNDFLGNIRSSPKTCSLKEVLRKYSVHFINLSKLLAILYHKQTYKGSHF